MRTCRSFFPLFPRDFLFSHHFEAYTHSHMASLNDAPGTRISHLKRTLHLLLGVGHLYQAFISYHVPVSFKQKLQFVRNTQSFIVERTYFILRRSLVSMSGLLTTTDSHFHHVKYFTCTVSVFMGSNECVFVNTNGILRPLLSSTLIA